LSCAGGVQGATDGAGRGIGGAIPFWLSAWRTSARSSDCVSVKVVLEIQAWTVSNTCGPAQRIHQHAGRRFADHPLVRLDRLHDCLLRQGNVRIAVHIDGEIRAPDRPAGGVDDDAGKCRRIGMET